MARGGFTLLELLVVVSIMGLVTAIGTQTFVGVTQAWNERKTLTELDAQADAVLDSIRRDVTDALSATVSGVSIQGTSNDVKDERTFPAALNANDSLMVPIRAVDANRAVAVPASVGYRVERTGEAGVLVRTIGPLGKEFPSTNRTDLMPNARVMGFCVEFLATGSGAMWTRAWTRSEMPAAVRVSLSIEDVDRPDQFQSSRQIVIPVRVR